MPDRETTIGQKNSALRGFPQRCQMQFTTSNLIHQPRYAILQHRYVEVDQESYFSTRQLQIGQKLRFVDRFYIFTSFQFDNQLVSDDKIQSISAIQSYPFVLLGNVFCLSYAITLK